MNSFSIALKLFRTNVRIYGYYMAVMIFAVGVYYDFMVLKHSPEVLKSQETLQYTKSAAEITSFVLIVTLIFFMWYSSEFFLKQRKKEIGIYSLMGISNSKIGFVFAVESAILGITSVGLGLFLGIILSKLFIMALAKVALLNVVIEFSIPLSAVKEVLLTFGIIFLALSLRNFINVARSRLIDMISDARKDEGVLKLKVVRGILAIVLIGLGYYLSTRVFEKIFIADNFLILTMLVVILIVLGTYWFFGAFLSMVMGAIIPRKSIMYRGVSIVSISNIAFRLKGNYRSLAMLAIMAATTITAFGTSLSLQYYIDSTHRIQFPFSFSYISDDTVLQQKVTDVIERSGHDLLLKEQVRYLTIDSVQMKDVPFFSNSQKIVVNYSDFIRLSRDLKVENLGKLLQEFNISPNEVCYIEAPGVIASAFIYKGNKLLFNNREYVIKADMKTPLFGDAPILNNAACIIVNDECYKDLKTKYKELTFNGFLVSDAEKTINLAAELMRIVPEENGLFAYVGMYLYKFQTIGMFFFLGAFMSIVFILATGSIMYFKLLSEGLADKSKYEILGKIGMSKKRDQ